MPTILTHAAVPLALYAANSDNFLTLNDRQAADGRVDLLLVHGAAAGPRPSAPVGVQVIEVPTRRGLLLMRVLVADRTADEPAAQAIRQTLRCDPA